MVRSTILWAACVAMPLLQACTQSVQVTAVKPVPHAGPPKSTPTPPRIGRYEAENFIPSPPGQNVTLVGYPDFSDRKVGDLGGEASQRQAVTLGPGGLIHFTVQAADDGANAVVLRYSIPDAPGGGGQTLPSGLIVTVTDPQQGVIDTAPLTLNSRYSWLYGSGTGNITLLGNIPATNMPYTTHLYDEIQVRLKKPIGAGDQIQLQNGKTSPSSFITVDFIELEKVPAPISMPAGFISITDPRCGVVPFDVNGTGFAFDGKDDSIYGSVFKYAISLNSPVPEKDYYVNAPSDALQDQTINSAIGYSLFDLADHNLKSLQGCMSLAQNYSLGVYVPPGRFYIRGLLQLPDNATLQGAGMWDSKFVAVNTATPTPVLVNGKTVMSGKSGNFILRGSSISTPSHVKVSDLSFFGNVTQRDTVDAVAPYAIDGAFKQSTFDHVWIEHYGVGFSFYPTADQVTVSNSRVRNTFADGIDFFGSTSNSLLTQSNTRSNGDDGVAIWSSSSNPSAPAQNNIVQNSTSELQWIGNGFAIYGGINNQVIGGTATDTLTGPCLEAGTAFAPASFTSNTPPSMTASIQNMQLIRCGKGALYFSLNSNSPENVSSISAGKVSIYDPMNSAIDISNQCTGCGPNGAGVNNTHMALSSLQLTGIHVLGNILSPRSNNGASCAYEENDIYATLTAHDVCYLNANKVPVSCFSPAGSNQSSTFSIADSGCDLNNVY